VDEDVQPLPPQTHKPWMDPSTAISMVKGEIEGLDELIGAMAKMEVKNEDAMDMGD